MNKKIILIAGISLILASFQSSNDVIDSILLNLQKFREEYPQEKVYLHTDRHIYAPGETLWFNAYLTIGANNQLSTLSKTLYVQLLDSANNPVISKKIYIESGVAHGDIQLPNGLNPGQYTVRSYTNWMRNFPSQYFFYKKINVVTTVSTLMMSSRKERDEKIDLQFFPESGALVEGIKSKVGFKAIGIDGLGVDVKGALYNSKNQKVLDFESLLHGMGHFYLLPKENETYYAVLNSDNQTQYSLPKSEEFGVVMTVTNNEQNDSIVIRINSKLNSLNEFIFLANSRGFPQHLTKVKLFNTLTFIKIPKDNLLNGITQLILLNSSGYPTNERLVFNHSKRELNIKIKPDKELYTPRSLTRVELEVTDQEGKPVEALLSLAVVNQSEVSPDVMNSNIVHYTQLNSELTGYIENPSLYFDENYTDRFEALDNLLITQGWTLFSWKQLSAGKFTPIEYYIEQGLNITGNLLDNVNKKPVQNGKVVLLSHQGDVAVAPTGKTGKFIFNDLIFYDSSKISLQGRNSKGKNWVEFKMDPDETFDNSANIFQNIKLFENRHELFAINNEERKKNGSNYNIEKDVVVLGEVIVRSTRLEEDDIKIYKAPSRSIKVEDVSAGTFMTHPLQLLQGRLAGVYVYIDELGLYSVRIRGVGSISSGTGPLILVDNVPVDISFLYSLPVTEIESVDVFKGVEAAIFGSQGGNGAIAFYTKRGIKGYLPPLGIQNLEYVGYAVAKEFYKPKYDVNQDNDNIPDRRVTLHWEPSIRTNENGRTYIEFYNHDTELSDIRIEVQGMTRLGIPGAATKNYWIRDNLN